MFERWLRGRRRPVEGTQGQGVPAEQAGAGGEHGAEPASAGPAEGEPPAPARRARRVERRTAEERRRLLEELGASGLEPSEFARQRGLPLSTLVTWLRKAGQAPARAVRSTRRFTPEERRTAVEAFLKSGRKREDFARLWGCSPSSLDKWVRRYRDEGPRALEDRAPAPGRRAPHPKRLSEEVRALIEGVAREHADFGAHKVADHLARFHGLRFSPSTVRKVLRERGVPGQCVGRPRKRAKSHLPRRFERARPGELWQSDITSFVLRRQGRRVYLTVFLDDHSRYVVAWALATHQRTPLVSEPLLEGIARFGKPREVLTDQGRQYYAWRGKSGFQKLLAKEGIAHVVSRAHHPETLGKCERLWKTVGEEFWERAAPEDLEDARRRLGHWFRHYNHFRPHQSLDGLVPADRFFGAESDVRQALERECSANELRLALGEAPRQSVYLTGRIGSQRIALHGERGRLLVETPEGRRELALESLGIERAEEQEGSGDGRDQGTAGGGDDAGDGGEDGAGDRDGEAQAPARGPQADRIPHAAAPGVAGAGPVGGRAEGRARAGAPRVHPDPGVLAGQEEQGPGGERTGGEAAAGLAALPAGALGDDGGASEAAAAAREDLGAPGDADRQDPGDAGAQDRVPGARAGAHGGPGAGAEDGPLADGGDGISRKGRAPSWQPNPQESEGACRGTSGCESPQDSRAARSGRRSWRWWLRRMG